MYNRAYIKDLAKQRFSMDKGNAILVAFLYAILGGASGGFSGVSSSFRNFNNSDGGSQFNIDPEILLALSGVLIIVGLVIIALSILVFNVIEVGANGWFLRYHRGETPSVGEMFASFRIYAPVVKTMLLYTVYLVLGFFLCIIPGIIFYYQYSMVPYIIYENPNLS